MYKTNEYYVSVNIQLENGVYTLPNESAIGKTYLAKVLREYSNIGEPVLSLTYYDFNDGVDLRYYTSKKDYKVLLLDRFDMYNDKFEDIIFELGRHMIVLLDSKLVPEFTAEHCNNIGSTYLSFDQKDLIEVGD